MDNRLLACAINKYIGESDSCVVTAYESFCANPHKSTSVVSVDTRRSICLRHARPLGNSKHFLEEINIFVYKKYGVRDFENSQFLY